MTVKYVMQASSVQVLEWRHLKNALMEHTVTQVELDIVFCVQKVIGEVLGSSTHWPQMSTDHSSIRPFIISFIDIIGWCLRDRLQIQLVITPIHPYVLFDFVIHSGWLPYNQATDIILFIQSSLHVVHFIHCHILAGCYTLALQI